MKYWTPCRYGLALTSALAFTACPTFAQDNQAEETDDEVVELSPFVVETSKDVGYMATNSISGTRLNMAIKDVPMNLEVITSKFIQDTGASNLREALRYSSGLVLSSQNDFAQTPDFSSQSAKANDPRGFTRTVGDSGTKLRGFTGDTMLQDGFRRNFSVDSVNLERVEVLRGPSALLYGVGNFGGVINFISKKAIYDREMYHLGVTVGSHDLYRTELDVNYPLVNAESSWAKYKPAIRVNAAWEQSENETQYYKQNHWVVNTAFSFKPFETTTVNLSAEFGYKNEVGVGFQSIRANAGSNAEAASREAMWVTDIYDYTTGVKTGSAVDLRSFRWSGDDTYIKGPYMNLSADIEQKFGENTYFKFGYSHSHYEFNSRQVNASVTQGSLPSQYTSAWSNETYTNRSANLYSRIGTNLDYSNLEGSNAPVYTDNGVLTYLWRDVDSSNDRDQVRAEIMSKLDLGDWGLHTFVVGLSYEQLYTVTKDYEPAQTFTETYYAADGTTILTGDTFIVRDYDRYSYKRPNDYTAFEYGTQGDGIPDNPRVYWTKGLNNSWDLGSYAMYQGQFFNDSLTAVGGIRWDRVDARSRTEYVYANANSARGMLDDVAGRIEGDKVPTAYSPQLGLSYRINDALSTFAVFSTGVVPNFFALDGNNKMLSPTKARNYEAGIKFDVMDGKLSGTLSVYHIEREGVPYFVWWAPAPARAISAGYDATEGIKLVAECITPAGFYYGLFNSGLDLQTAVATAKSVWPKCWWPLIDEIAVTGANGVEAANGGPIASTFWWSSADTLAECQTMCPSRVACYTATVNADTTSEVYYPLVDYSLPNVSQFMQAIQLQRGGWYGNHWGTNGTTYMKYDAATGNTVIDTANTMNVQGANVPLDDESNGWDLQVTWQPIPEFQVVAGFSHLVRKVTSKTFKLVSAPYSPGAFWLASSNGYGTFDDTLSASDVYYDIDDTSTYHGEIPCYGKSLDDSPENTFTIWSRYELSHMTDVLKGFAIGLGAQYEDNRCWYYGFTGGQTRYATGTRTLIQYWTPERITVNGMVEYKTKLADKYDVRLAVNVDNIMNDKELYGLIYASGRFVKVSVSVDF